MELMQIFGVLLLTIVLLGCMTHVNSRKRKSQTTSDEDVLEYSSKEELNEKLKSIKSKQSHDVDEELTSEEIASLLEEEKIYKKGVNKAIRDFGEISENTAKALHKLGRVVYKLKKYSEAMDISKRILKIHENMYGKEHVKTADALGNLGSAAYRVGAYELCAYAMKRMLYILLEAYGEDSKEVLRQRARMLTFQIKEGRESEGLSADEAEEEYEHLEL
mmetsp:Transcript_20093/g.20204  ORF Transcript_20093/g.20204 Transcript_20093/m.20204 type:complete len:219 (+) Transcript_20093:79-735(+)